MRSNGRTGAGCIRIFKLRHEAQTFEAIRRRLQVAEFGKCRINIKKLDRRLQFAPWQSQARQRSKELALMVPESVLSSDLFLTEVVAMVGPDYNDRIILLTAGLERIEHAANLCIHKADAGKVGRLYS